LGKKIGSRHNTSRRGDSDEVEVEVEVEVGIEVGIQSSLKMSFDHSLSLLSSEETLGWSRLQFQILRSV